MGKPLAVKHAENMRELGGYTNKDGKKVASQKLIRSAAINLLDETDQNYLEKYGIRKIVDFRSTDERSSQPDKDVTLAENIFLPIFPEKQEKKEESTASPQALLKRMENGESAFGQMMDAYESFVLDDYVRKQYHKFFEIVLANENPNESVLFHCTAGKDRTGFGALLLLSGLGVDRDTAMTDYLATNEFLKGFTDNMLQHAKENGVPDALLASVKDMTTARKEYLTKSLNLIDENYGTVDNFLIDGIGLHAADLKDLQRLYLE